VSPVRSPAGAHPRPPTAPAAACRPALLAGVAALALLSGCALTPAASPLTLPVAPAGWQAPPPAPLASETPAAARADWWQRFDDPLLPALVTQAQATSPALAAAAARVAQARALRDAAAARGGPALDLGAAAVRGQPDLRTPVGTQLGAEARAGWEIDLFGRVAATTAAARAQLAASEADARGVQVALAAEVGTAFLALRACEAQRATLLADARSREETVRLTERAAAAGLRAPAAAELARAGAAHARMQAQALQQRCELELKALVALTGADEPGLRERLAATPGRLPRPPALALTELPAQVLAQRPDLQAAERRIAAAQAEVAQARAETRPRVTLAGMVGLSRLSGAGVSVDGGVWSLGPLQVTLPLFDGGARAAGVEAARARHDEAGAHYLQTLRAAVRELESALVQLAGTAARAADTALAAAGFEASLRATQALYDGGLASLFDLEDARRSALAAQRELIELERERSAAWIALYRATAGGWSAAAGTPPAAALDSTAGVAAGRLP